MGAAQAKIIGINYLTYALICVFFLIGNAEYWPFFLIESFVFVYFAVSVVLSFIIKDFVKN